MVARNQIQPLAVLGLDDAVRGAKKDGEITFTFTPQNGDWTGVELVVHVKVQAVRERELPELNDDFAKLASEFETLKELEADVREPREAGFDLVQQALGAGALRVPFHHDDRMRVLVEQSLHAAPNKFFCAFDVDLDVGTPEKARSTAAQLVSVINTR